MSNSTIKKLVLSLILTIASLFTLPTYAWPEVDTMNMCGSAVKTARAYGGGFKGWQSRDQYVNQKSRTGAYYQNNCPGTIAPAKAYPAKRAVKRVRKVRKARKARKTRKVRRARKARKSRSRKSRKRYVTKCRYVKRCTKVRAKKRIKKRRAKKRGKAKRKYPYIAKSKRAKRFKRKVRVKYDKHADCARVDRVNRS